MIQFIETTGKTTDDALRAALEELGLTRDEVSVEILTMPKSGFLGIGAVPARLRVSYDDGRTEPKPPRAPNLPSPRRERKPQPAIAVKLRRSPLFSIEILRLIEGNGRLRRLR